MKNIITKKFKIDGKLQLGFQRLQRQDINNLRCIKGFRYCSLKGIWHTDYFEGIIPYLNHTFPGTYYFTGDIIEDGGVEDIEGAHRALVMRVYLDSVSGVLYLKHTFHKDLWRSLLVIEGGKYHSKRRVWQFRDGRHYDHIKKLARSYGFRVQLENSKNRGTEEFMNGGSRSVRHLVPAKESRMSDPHSELISKLRLELRLRNRSGRTIGGYLDCIRSFLIYFTSSDIKSLSMNEIRGYLNQVVIEKGYSYSTINVHISAIKFLYISLYGRSIDEIQIPRPKLGTHFPEVLSIDEVKRLIDSCGNLKHKLVISMLYSTGMRRSEIIGLKVGRIDFASRSIMIRGKGNKDRVVYMPQKLVKQIDQYTKAYKPVEYLIEGQGGGRYSATSIANIIEKARRRSGIDKRVTPHLLRHSYATHLVTSGVSLSYVQKILGHSSIKTTMIYTHIADNDLKNIENPLDKMDI